VKKFKENWEIKSNWQLIFPFLGSIALGYSSYKLANLFLKDFHIALTLLLTAILFFILLKITLFIFKKLENKWQVNYRWELISIFLVFASTGSSSMFVSRPIMKLIGITKENLNPFIYWIIYIIFGFIFYQILLVFIGWLLGQFQFFWNFEKKMLSRLGFKRFIN
jgi:hypothetical protein